MQLRKSGQIEGDWLSLADTVTTPQKTVIERASESLLEPLGPDWAKPHDRQSTS
jgi:hypothetical protein